MSFSIPSKRASFILFNTSLSPVEIQPPSPAVIFLIPSKLKQAITLIRVNCFSFEHNSLGLPNGKCDYYVEDNITIENKNNAIVL